MKHILHFLKLFIPRSLDDGSKFSPRHFTRRRKFTVPILIFTIFYLISDQSRFGYKHLLQTVALVSKCYHIFSDVPYDFAVAGYYASERELAISHLDHLKPGDVVIGDRGFPGFIMFWELLKRNLHFIFRAPLNSWSVIISRNSPAKAIGLAGLRKKA